MLRVKVIDGEYESFEYLLFLFSSVATQCHDSFAGYPQCISSQFAWEGGGRGGRGGGDQQKR